jgi:hypothetical protein
MKQPTWNRSCSFCLVSLLLSAWLLTASATIQSGLGNSYIEPSSKVPDFNPAAWNQAFKLTLRNVPAAYSSSEVLHSLSFPNTMPSSSQVACQCLTRGFDTVSAAADVLVSASKGRLTGPVQLVLAGKLWQRQLSHPCIGNVQGLTERSHTRQDWFVVGHVLISSAFVGAGSAGLLLQSPRPCRHY